MTEIKTIDDLIEYVQNLVDKQAQKGSDIPNVLMVATLASILAQTKELKANMEKQDREIKDVAGGGGGDGIFRCPNCDEKLTRFPSGYYDSSIFPYCSKCAREI